MTGLLTFILIIYGIIWLIKKNKNLPENPKEKLLYAIQDIKDDFNREITGLKHRIQLLEAEIANLKAAPFVEQEFIIEQESTTETSTEFTEIESMPDEKISETVLHIDSQEHIEAEGTLYKVITTDDRSDKAEKQKADIESFVATNLFNKIGAIAIILGMGFFLKYAFDQNWISPVFQVLTGFLVASGLLYGGKHFYEKEEFRGFSQGLAGAGIAISYLSTFAAYNFYHLINYPFALILMCCSTMLAFYQALKYDSVAVALLGLTGGFLTPFVLYSSGGTSIGLFTYLIFLNGWILALLRKKENWKSLEIISIIATYSIFFGTHGANLADNSSFVSALFLTIIWAAYSVLDIFRLAKGTSPRTYVNIMNGILYYAGINAICSQSLKAPVTFVISLCYLTVGIWVYKKINGSEAYLKQNILASILLLVISTSMAFSEFAKVMIWAFEAICILWLGIKYKKAYVWKTANFLFSLSMVTLLFTFVRSGLFVRMDTFMPLLNIRSLAFGVLISLMITASKLLEKAEKANKAQEYLRYCWCTLVFIWLSVEINDTMEKLAWKANANTFQFISFNKSMVEVIVWMSYSFSLFKTGLSKKIQAFLYCGLIGTIIAVHHLLISGCSFVPIERFIPILNLRCTAFVITALSIMYMSKLLDRYEKNSSTLKTIFSYGWCILLFILLNCEVSDFFANKGTLLAINAESFRFNKSLVLSIVWALYSLPLISKGLREKSKPMTLCGGVSLVSALFLALINGYTYLPIEKFTFLLNPRMFVFSVLSISLVLVTRWLKRSSFDISIRKYITGIQIALSLLIFYVLSIEIKDLFAHEIMMLASSNNTQLDVFNNLKQLAMSGVWLVYSIALMVWGIFHKIKTVRYIALVILGLTILKVFVIDLSFLGQLYRIISFMGLGTIMLLASYYYQKYSKQIIRILNEEKEETLLES